jgi:O-antigen/teichoic acid export membrane protein
MTRPGTAAPRGSALQPAQAPATPAGEQRTPVRRSGRAAVGAVAAQFSQALASFMLTVVGVRSLSPADFGLLAVLLGSLVLATSVMTGFVGDSLTVLDRTDDHVRAALQLWCVVLVDVLALVAAGTSWATGLLDAQDASLFGLAVGAFVLEDTARRLLMATLRFWSIVTVDLTYLAAAAVLLLCSRSVGGPLRLGDFLAALMVGQLVATVVAVALLPHAERRLLSWHGASMLKVAAYGGLRALQQGIRPAALTGTRLMLLGASAVGAVGVGRLETARVCMSPALLFVAGTGSFLLAMSAADRRLPIAKVIRRADRVAGLLVLASLAVSLAVLAVLPWLGPLITGNAGGVDRLTVVGWAFFAVVSGASMPYASVAAVRVAPMLVLVLRLADTAFSLSLVGLVLWFAPDPAAATPYALAVGGCSGAVLQRWVGLRRAGSIAADPQAQAVPAA